MYKIQIIEWYDDIIKAVIEVKNEEYLFVMVFKKENQKIYLGIPIKEFVKSKGILEILKEGKIKNNYALFLKLLKKVKPINNPLITITEDINNEKQQFVGYKTNNLWLNNFFHFEFPEILENSSKHENWAIFLI